MLSYFDSIPSEATASVFILWVLREVFGFVTKMLKARNGGADTTRVLERVSTHIEAQTDLVKDMTRELKTLRHHVMDMKDEIRVH